MSKDPDERIQELREELRAHREAVEDALRAVLFVELPRLCVPGRLTGTNATVDDDVPETKAEVLTYLDEASERIGRLEVELKWQQNETDRLAAENKRLKATIPPDTDPVGCVQVAFGRLSQGERLQFAERFSGSPYLKTAIAMRHGRVPKYLQDLQALHHV